MRETKFSDVCGTIAEIRRILSEGDKLDAKKINEVRNLIQDALYMMGRMEKRLKEYENFRVRLLELIKEAETITAPGTKEAIKLANELEDIIPKISRSGNYLEDALNVAEEIRKIASKLEGALRSYKEKCIKLIEIYGEIKGIRDWSKDEESLVGKPLPTLLPLDKIVTEIRNWLPPEPHRTKILEFVRAGRAYIQRKRGQPPIVQFEDGGSIPLHKVRYSEKIRNFYPEDKPPK